MASPTDRRRREKCRFSNDSIWGFAFQPRGRKGRTPERLWKIDRGNRMFMEDGSRVAYDEVIERLIRDVLRSLRQYPGPRSETRHRSPGGWKRRGGPRCGFSWS